MFKTLFMVTLIVSIFGIFGISGIIQCVRAAAPKKLTGIQVYAHRGLRAYAPENSMPAYAAMMGVGADWADMDVVLTKDGEILVSHDPVMNPDIVRGESGEFIGKNKESVMNGPKPELAAFVQKYAAKNLTLAELKKFDVGALNPTSAYSKFFPDQIAVNGTRMPTLREVIRFVNEATHEKMGFQIEMKTDPTHPEFSADPGVFAAALAKILKSENILERSEIQAFDFACLSALRKIDPRMKTAFLTSRETLEPAWADGKSLKDYGDSIPKMVKALGGYAWEPEDAQLTETTLREAHELGLKVVVWSWPEQLGTAFDAKLTAKMIDWKVDGIITDDPGRLISMLAARGLRIPPRYAK